MTFKNYYERTRGLYYFNCSLAKFWRCVTEIIGNDISQDVISTLANNLNHVFPYYPASNQDFTYVELYGQERMLLSNS